LHDARHTAATLLLLEGVDQRTVMDVMGWSNPSMACRYQHVVPELRREAARRVGDAMWPVDAAQSSTCPFRSAQAERTQPMPGATSDGAYIAVPRRQMTALLSAALSVESDAWGDGAEVRVWIDGMSEIVGTGSTPWQACLSLAAALAAHGAAVDVAAQSWPGRATATLARMHDRDAVAHWLSGKLAQDDGLLDVSPAHVAAVRNLVMTRRALADETAV
jgi:hypothetical protein